MSGLLQRVVVPRSGEPTDVRSLYVDEGADRLRLDPVSRTAARLPAHAEISFGAYFNAFAAGYWRRWTRLDEVQLRLHLEGSGGVTVYRSKADGTRIAEHTEVLTGGDRRLDLRLDLRPFEDGGWYWFDVTTGPGGLVLHSGGWHAAAEPRARAAVTIGMPTFNRPADCVATLAALGADPLLLDQVTAVVIPDQGTRKVRDEPGFAAAAAPFGERLRVIDQPNLGGSGGYARIMLEALDGTDCEQILFMDDDVVVEPDSVLRAVAFARHTHEPVIVGGQMLSLQARSQLSTMGEVVDRRRFLWRNAPRTEPHHDLAEQPLRSTPWMHRRVDVDYNAWWMCLIPRTVAEAVGLPLPLFIKWDDAEYGLRARAAGYPTATVPGIAIWHMSFLEKDDTSDWQAYFHYRNRFVAAVLHGPADPRNLLLDSVARTVRHLLLMEYSAVALQHMALRDLLAGPEALFATLPHVLEQVRAARARYDDGRPLDPVAEVPRTGLDPLAAQSLPKLPASVPGKAVAALRGVVHNLRAPDPGHRSVPQRRLEAGQARWQVLGRLDSAVVTTPDGRAATFRRRDRALFRSLLATSVQLHREVGRAWPELRRRYRAELPHLTGRDGWKQLFHG